MEKITYRSETNIIDNTTGEIITTKSERITRIEKEPDYIKMYVSDIAGLHGFSKATSGVLFELLAIVDYKGVSNVTISNKKNMCQRIGIKNQTFTNQLQILIKKNIISRIEKGEYEINPNYFTKGSWSETKKRITSIEVNIKYDATGRKLQSKIK